jgi:cytochrome c oxidase cbb3-type subunit 2
VTQLNPDSDDVDAFSARYPKASVRDFDGDPGRTTEMDALIAYLQMLGTTVDFKTYQAEDPANQR